ncbi:MAG: class I SAM-dependent methyltransferase [Pseudomonadota bacterium]
MRRIRAIEISLLDRVMNQAFTVDGYCVPCGKRVAFLVDMQSGGRKEGGRWTPNWRERLECPICRMNNRQRLMAALIKQMLEGKRNWRVYFMEHVTPIFNWACNTFRDHTIIGSEYLGYEYEGGSVVNGIRHEDAENLSFGNNELDLLISNDVFEHVPNVAKAFAECARVLKPGGVMLATIPFHSGNDDSVTRAKLVAGKLEHSLPPAYHGNPVSADGSLVFTDFGWDVIDDMRAAGFARVQIEIYGDDLYGHLGGGQLVFRLEKQGAPL